jgi:hypothetical protein
MTPTQLTAVREKALQLAERTRSESRAHWYRHVALDADWAAEGCENSMDSVLDAIAQDHALDMAAYGVEAEATASEATSQWGMANVA